MRTAVTSKLAVKPLVMKVLAPSIIAVTVLQRFGVQCFKARAAARLGQGDVGQQLASGELGQRRQPSRWGFKPLPM